MMKINLQNSNLHDIGVNYSEVVQTATITGCLSATIAYIYLGLQVSECMIRATGSKTVIEIFHKQLSSYKVKRLSIGGLLTPINSVWGLLECFMCLFLKSQHQ